MQLILDVVDLLQLQEIWSRRPVITAFTRLEERPAAMPCSEDFNVDGLLPRLARLRRSAIWRQKHLNNDPARIPMRDFSEDYLQELYPEAETGAAVRRSLFNSAYNRYIFARFQGEVGQVCRLLRALAQTRDIETDACLSVELLPRHGSTEWIPADITDEIRSLDVRYKPTEPGLPAAYVVSDEFWPLLVKAEPDEIMAAVQLCCAGDMAEIAQASQSALTAMSQVAYAWNRSPSVVGLCYQVAEVD